MPLLAPGLMATSLFGFITAWNEFAYANFLIIKQQDNRTLPVWLSSFQNTFGTDWGPRWPPPPSSRCPPW